MDFLDGLSDDALKKEATTEARSDTFSSIMKVMRGREGQGRGRVVTSWVCSSTSWVCNSTSWVCNSTSWVCSKPELILEHGHRNNVHTLVNFSIF